FQTHKHPMKGKHHSKQSRVNMSLGHIGNKHTKQQKQKIAKSLKFFYKTHKKKQVSVKTKKLLAKATKNWLQTHSNPFLGKQHSKKTKLKMREAKQRYLKD